MSTPTNSKNGSKVDARASVLRNGRMVERDDVPEPVPGPGQVLVGVKGLWNLRL